jgi:hypothetical protein
VKRVAPSLCILALLLVACSTGQATPTPTPTRAATATATPGPTPAPVTGLLAPPPTDCATLDPPQTMTISDSFGGGFVGGDELSGAPPAWQLGLGGSPLDLEAYPPGTPTPRPYPRTKVLWIVGPNFTQMVTLSGRDLRTGTPIWFQVFGNGGDQPQDAVPSVALDPANPNRGNAQNSSGSWSIFGVGMYFTVAGCYRLDVTWPGGGWHANYAVGR